MSRLAQAEAEIAELRKWKESALENCPDLQAIGKLLNVKLGDSISDKIIPAIEELQGRIQELEAALRLETALRHLAEKELAEMFEEQHPTQDPAKLQ